MLGFIDCIYFLFMDFIYTPLVFGIRGRRLLKIIEPYKAVFIQYMEEGNLEAASDVVHWAIAVDKHNKRGV